MSWWAWAAGVLLCAGAARAGTNSVYRFDEVPGKSLSLLCGTNLLWTLHFDGKEHKPYFHPLRTPAGVDLTGHRPPDHPWHLGLWYSWKYINHANFWDPKEHDPYETGPGVIGIQNIRIQCRADFSATVTYELSYRIGSGPVLLNESVTLAIAPPGADGTYWIDWRQTSTVGDTPLLLERTPPATQGGPPWGGYAGLSYRCAPGLTQCRALDSTGWTNTIKLVGSGRPAKWLDFSGMTKEPVARAAGVTLMDYPGNPRAPSPWYVYMSGAIGLAKTALLFNEPLKLAPHEKLALRYRVLVHEGRGEKAQLDAAFDRFAHAP